MLRPIYIEDVERNDFFKFYHFLLENDKYNVIKSDSKIMYCLYMDRVSLSKNNNWVDSNKRIYIIFSNEEIAKKLKISLKKVIDCKKELIKLGLIEEKRQGLNKPNLIFVFNDTFERNTSKKNAVKEVKENSLVENSEIEKSDTKQETVPDKIQTNTKDIISHNEFFEKVWKNILNNDRTKGSRIRQGKGSVKDTQRKELMKIGEETLNKCLDLYLSEHTDKKYHLKGSTWFNSGYIDYLDQAKEVEVTKVEEQDNDYITNMIWGDSN